MAVIFCFFVVFSSFTNFFFFSAFQENAISCVLLISRKLKSFLVSFKYDHDEGRYNTHDIPFSTLYHFYSLVYGEKTSDIQFLPDIQKFHT